MKSEAVKRLRTFDVFRQRCTVRSLQNVNVGVQARGIRDACKEVHSFRLS
jgi:hypothetical protein